MNKRLIKVGMVLQLKDIYDDQHEIMYYDYEERLFLVISNNKEKDYIEALDQEFNTVKIPRDDLKKYIVTGLYHKDKWNVMFDKLR